MSGSEHTSDLIARLRSGDASVMPELAGIYGDLIYGLALRIVQDPEAAEKVSLSVFKRVRDEVGTYSEKKSRFSSWIINLTRHQSGEELRSRQHQGDSSREAPTKVYDAAGKRSVLTKLRPEQQNLLRLVYFGPRTHEEAAKELSIPLGTVKTRLRGSILELRKQLHSE